MCDLIERTSDFTDDQIQQLFCIQQCVGIGYIAEGSCKIVITQDGKVIRSRSAEAERFLFLEKRRSLDHPNCKVACGVDPSATTLTDVVGPPPNPITMPLLLGVLGVGVALLITR